MTICIICGAKVTARDPQAYPYCKTCHYSGAAQGNINADKVEPFALAFPNADVLIEHTGGGCHWLAIYPKDTGSYPMYALTDGDANLPAEDETTWGCVVRYNHVDDEGTAIAWNVDEEDDRWVPLLTVEQCINAIKADMWMVQATAEWVAGIRFS